MEVRVCAIEDDQVVFEFLPGFYKKKNTGGKFELPPDRKDGDAEEEEDEYEEDQTFTCGIHDVMAARKIDE